MQNESGNIASTEKDQAGIDDVHAEYINYAPPSVHEHIAHILKTTAKVETS